MPPLPYATLFDTVLRLAREIILVREGAATSGTTLSLTDSVNTFPIDTFRGGTLFLPGSSKFKTITQHNAQTFTWVGALTAPVAADRYAVTDNDIPLDVMVSAVNSAIRAMTVPAEDETTTTIANQEEYTLPANVSKVFKVEVASSLTTPYGYVEHFRWNEAAGKLRFPTKFSPGSDGYKIRLTYRRTHTDIVLEAAAIPNDINLDYLHWTAVQNAAKYGQRVHNNDSKRDWPAKIQESEVRIQRLASLQPKPHRSPRLSDY